jgi:hypothetical protein
MESNIIRFLVKMFKKLLALNNIKDSQELEFIKEKQ